MHHPLGTPIGAGFIGGIHLLRGACLQDWPPRPEDDDRRVDPALGGASRAVADTGSHWRDLIEFANGHRITRLSARTTTVNEQRHTGSGPAFSADRGTGPPRRLGAEDGAVMRYETGQGALLPRDPGRPSAPAARRATMPAGHPEGYAERLNRFVADTCDAIDGAAPDGLPQSTDGLRAAHITDAVLASSQEERWNDVSTPALEVA